MTMIEEAAKAIADAYAGDGFYESCPDDLKNTPREQAHAAARVLFGPPSVEEIEAAYRAYIVEMYASTFQSFEQAERDLSKAKKAEIRAAVCRSLTAFLAKRLEGCGP